MCRSAVPPTASQSSLCDLLGARYPETPGRTGSPLRGSAGRRIHLDYLDLVAHVPRAIPHDAVVGALEFLHHPRVKELDGLARIPAPQREKRAAHLEVRLALRRRFPHDLRAK